MGKKFLLFFILINVVFGVSTVLASSELEPNDTIQQATSITVNGEYYGVLGSYNDLDYFGFTLSEAGNVTISMPNSVTASWQIDLYSSSGTVLNTFYTQNGEFVSGDTVDEIGLPQGTYYLRISRNNSASIEEPYSFKLQFDNKGLFEQEPNNSVQTATPFILNNSYQGNLNFYNDMDFYKFALAEPGNITMSMPNSISASWVIELYNSSGSVLNTFYTESGEFSSGEAIGEVGLPEGTYYVQIRRNNSASIKTPYQLTIDYKESRFFEREGNNTVQEANPIELNYRYQGVLNYYNDTDHFKFNVDSPGTHVISFPNQTDASWAVQLYDQQGQTLETLYTDSGSFTSNISSKQIGLSRGTYYLRVSRNNSGSIKTPYSFVVSSQKFRDVHVDYWGFNEITYLFNKNIIKGYSDSTFRPNNQVTRSQAAIMISRALNLNVSSVSNPGYRDVATDFHSYKEIAAVTNAGIFPKQTTFRPNDTLTRAEMATALVNAYQLTGTYNGQIKDVQDPETLKNVNALAANRITNIYSDHTFRPNNPVTRAQFSAFFSRILDDEFKE